MYSLTNVWSYLKEGKSATNIAHIYLLHSIKIFIET